MNTNKGKAYIDFETQEEADKALSYMDNVMYSNRFEYRNVWADNYLLGTTGW